MPYRSVKDLPKAQVRRYSPKGKRAFLHAFNSAVYEQGLSEERAFKIAHSAAKKAEGRPKVRQHRAKS